MTRGEFDAYLLVVALLAGFLGVVNLLRPHRRWLGAGAILLGGAAMLYRQGTPMIFVVVPCGLAVVCLGKDAASRPPREKRTGGKRA